MTALYNAARDAHANGLCVIPAATNGTKQPWPDGPAWKRYQSEHPTPEQLEAWFSSGEYDGLGVVCGAISGGLEMFEFEGRAVAEGVMRELGEIADASGLGDLWTRVTEGYMEVTPSGGFHLLYRVEGDVGGNTKLARRPSTPEELAAWKAEQQLSVDKVQDPAIRADRQEKLDQTTAEQVPQVLIETRGERGFVVAAPSAGRTHPSGAAWTLKAGGPATIPTITAEERDALHHLAGALDQMPPAKEEPTRRFTPPPSYDSNGSQRPGDDYNNRADWDDIITPRGWTKTYTSRGVTYWCRPGKTRGVSATTGRNGADNLFVFSTSTEFEDQKPYSKFAAYTLLTEGAVNPATCSAAGKALRAQGYGSRPAWDATRPLTAPAWQVSEAPMPMQDDHPWPEGVEEPPSNLGDPIFWSAGETGTDDAEPDPPSGPVRRRGRLPEDFWDARPVLTHIRRAAHTRARSGDIVLGGLLARLSSLLPPDLRADTGVGSPASLNIFSNLLGPSGSGKSSAAWIPRRILPAPLNLDFLDELPLGSGEGIAEAYMGEKAVETGEIYRGGPKKGDPKTETVRMQVRHNALFYADEGEALTKQLFGRNGATVGESLRRAWTGGTIGQFNGHKVNTRVIESGTYSLGMVVGFQPETALPMLEDAAAGTPQRFLWFSSTDPSIPEDLVDDPGPLYLELIRHGFGAKPKVEFAPALIREIRQEDRARATGEMQLPPLDSHKPLMLVKLASLLAILDNRLNVTVEDWQLAHVVWDASCGLRDALVEYGARQLAEAAEKQTRAHVDREVRAHAAKAAADHDVERVARRVAKRVRENAKMTRGALKKDTASRDRGWLSAAIDYAEARGWVTTEADEVAPGDSMPS